MARGLKFLNWKVEGLYYLCSENKDADPLRGYREADLRLCFCICKSRFSHNEAHFEPVSSKAIGCQTIFKYFTAFRWLTFFLIDIIDLYQSQLTISQCSSFHQYLTIALLKSAEKLNLNKRMFAALPDQESNLLIP